MDKCLIIDSTSEELYVAVIDGKNEFELKNSASGTEYLMVAIDEILKKANITIDDISIIAVNVGPGSWTGSRVGVVTTFGLVSGNKKIKVVPYNTFDLISYYASEDNKKLYLVKAYANFVYVKEDDKEPKCIQKNAVASYDYKKFALEKIFDDVIVVKNSAIGLVRDKIKNKQFSSVSQIEPMYIRLSQAEYQLMDKKGIKHD